MLDKIRAGGKSFSKLEDYAKDLMTKLDKNKDGFLSFEEFCDGLRSLGIIVTYQEEHTLMRRFDSNQDNRISLEEFITTLAQPSAPA